MDKKGFTIIELIVVIAVIAVLSAIVMINVVSYKDKSREAAIKAEMSQLSRFGVNYFYTKGNYEDFCDSLEAEPFFMKISDFAGSPIGCNNGAVHWKVCCVDRHGQTNDGLSWAVCAKLITEPTSAWCSDYTGVSRKISLNNCENNMITNNLAVCPAS
jgi:prepilin-type N-terminal cleavage/methylation domain-containing protein